MNYCDLNIHLPMPSSFPLMLEDDISLRGEKLIEQLRSAISAAGSQLTRANIMLFNQELADEDVRKASSCDAGQVELFFTLLSSPRFIRTFSRLECYKRSGISAVKFHSYQQEISSESFDSYIVIAKWAELLSMPILIDASYGSLGMYEYDNLKLVAEIALEIKNVPIVILHSGGARAIEALLLAEAVSNIFLETSFSLPYYRDSSIELDFAFAYKKLGTDRVVYASDYPYVDHEASLHAALSFCERHSFSEEDQKWIFKDTFNKIFPRKL